MRVKFWLVSIIFCGFSTLDRETLREREIVKESKTSFLLMVFNIHEQSILIIMTYKSKCFKIVKLKNQGLICYKSFQKKKKNYHKRQILFYFIFSWNFSTKNKVKKKRKFQIGLNRVDANVQIQTKPIILAKTKRSKASLSSLVNQLIGFR